MRGNGSVTSPLPCPPQPSHAPCSTVPYTINTTLHNNLEHTPSSMKLSIKFLLIASAIVVATQSSIALAEGGEAVSTSESAPIEADATEAEIPNSSETTDDSGSAQAEESTSEEGDAGKECVAEECAEPADTEESVVVEEKEAVSAEEAAVEQDDSPSEPEPVIAEEEKVPEDPKCPSRPHVIRCAAKYLDSNQDGALERSELESAMNEVPWLLRSLLKIIGSVDSIMKKCDADGDGKIDIENDMEATKETCLASCFKRNAFKRLFFPECTE